MRLTSFTTPTLFKSDIVMMIFPTNSALRNFHKHKGSYMLQFLSYFDLKKNQLDDRKHDFIHNLSLKNMNK